MEHSLRILMTVPVDRSIGLVFSCYLPFERDALEYQSDRIGIRVWLDETCVADMEDAQREQFTKFVQIRASSVRVEVRICGLDARLCECVIAGQSKREDIVTELESVYEAIGDEIHAAVVDRINHLLSYARVNKNQSWLHLLERDRDARGPFFSAARARATTDDLRWQHFAPPPRDQILRLKIYSQCGLSAEDWSLFRDPDFGTERGDLSLELLANADELFDDGHFRASLVEAISALQVALERFARAPNPERLTRELPPSINLHGLARLVEKMGLTSTIDFLLPVLFRQDSPSDAVGLTQAAIRARNTVVHQGQRRVDPKVLRDWLRAVRSTCQMLMAATSQSRLEK